MTTDNTLNALLDGTTTPGANILNVKDLINDPCHDAPQHTKVRSNVPSEAPVGQFKVTKNVLRAIKETPI